MPAVLFIVGPVLIICSAICAAWLEMDKAPDNPSHDHADPYLAKSARRSLGKSPRWVGERSHSSEVNGG